MNNNQIKFPFYAKLSFLLVSLTIITFFIYVAHSIILPILISMLFAVLLRPVVRFCSRKLRFPHVLAVLTSVLLFMICISSIVLFVSWRIGDIANDWDKIQANVQTHYENLQSWIERKFNISYDEQLKYIQKAEENSLSKGASIMGNTLSSFTDFLMSSKNMWELK